MPIFEEEPVKPKRAHEVGQDLSTLSVDELTARIELLNEEIVRLDAERNAKQSGRSAADALFSRK